MAKKTNVIMGLLIAIIIVLAAIMIYAFVVQPAILNRQSVVYNAGYTNAQIDFINGMLTQIQQIGYVQIPLGNQTLLLAPVQTQAPMQ